MQAFHNEKKIREKYINRVKAHSLADEIVKGQYWSNGKGCAVGCTIHSGEHAAYERELGIPRLLARLEDGIFEGLPNGLAKEWPLRFLSSIKLGADLSMVWPKFATWMLTDSKWGVLQFAKSEASKEAIQAVSDFYFLQSEGETIDIEDWREVRAAADAADAAYAYAAAAAAADADDAAAYAYAAAAADAAYADDAADGKNTREEWRVAQADKLIELLKACK